MNWFSDFCHLRHGRARSGSILMHECFIQKLSDAQQSVCKATRSFPVIHLYQKPYSRTLIWFRNLSPPHIGPARSGPDRVGPIESSRRPTMQTQWSTIIIHHRTILWTDYRWSLGSLGPRTWKSDRSGPRRTDVGTIFDLFWKYECMGNGWS